MIGHDHQQGVVEVAVLFKQLRQVADLRVDIGQAAAVGAQLVLGIDLGGTKIEIAMLDAGGGTVLQRRVDTPAGDYDATLAAVAVVALICATIL